MITENQFFILCGIFFALVLLPMMALRILRIRRQNIAIRQTYLDSLQRLKLDPGNPDLRQAALAAGRAYSNMTRNHEGVTLFDEVALMNDINAASAAALANTGTAPTLEARLARLEELKASGTINDDEYRSRRAKMLDEL